MNPHNWITRLGKPPLDRWECHYCKARGTFDALHAQACTYVYPPCVRCGQTPTCAADCTGIVGLLVSPAVVVIGAPPALADAIGRKRWGVS